MPTSYPTGYPGSNDTYIPAFDGFKPLSESLTIEQVRAEGEIVLKSEDGTRATVCVRRGLVLSFCGVLLAPDGTITDFVPRPINKYVKLEAVVHQTPPEQLFKQFDPPEHKE